MDKYRTCLGCQDREPGCHGRCQGYQQRYQNNREKDKQNLLDLQSDYHSDFKPLKLRRNGKGTNHAQGNHSRPD